MTIPEYSRRYQIISHKLPPPPPPQPSCPFCNVVVGYVICLLYFSSGFQTCKFYSFFIDELYLSYNVFLSYSNALIYACYKMIILYCYYGEQEP